MTKKRIWIEIHQVCGDCGRRIKEDINLETNDLKTVQKLVKYYYPYGNMACKRCSNK